MHPHRSHTAIQKIVTVGLHGEMNKIYYVLAFTFITSLSESLRYRRGLEPYLRNNNKFFFRMNIKNNMFATNVLIAYASGYRINWDMAPMLKERSSTNRQHLHQFIQNIMQRHGFDGEACIKQATCELTTRNPIDAVDKIVHLLLRKEDEESLCSGFDNASYNCSFPLLGLTSYILEQAFRLE